MCGRFNVSASPLADLLIDLVGLTYTRARQLESGANRNGTGHSPGRRRPAGTGGHALVVDAVLGQGVVDPLQHV